MTFTIFDILMLTIIGVSSFLGLHKGFLKIVINILAFIASIILTIWLYPYGKILLSDYISSEITLNLSSVISSYLLSLIITTVINRKVCSLVSSKTSDKLIGMIAGLFRGYLIALFIFTVIAIMLTGSYNEAQTFKEIILKIDNEKFPDWLKTSYLTPALDKSARVTATKIPDEWLEFIELAQPIDSKNTDDIIDSINKKNSGVKSKIELISTPENIENTE